MPERKIGFEALEASAKLRKSSIDCLSAASFETARSEQLRLPAEGPLKRGSTLLTTPTKIEGKGWQLLYKQAHSLVRTGVLNSHFS